METREKSTEIQYRQQISKEAGKCLVELLQAELQGHPPEIHVWRARNGKKIETVKQLMHDRLLAGDLHFEVTFWGLVNAPGKLAASALQKCERAFKALRKYYPENPKEPLALSDLAQRARMTPTQALQSARFLSRSPVYLSIQEADPENIRLSPNEQYITFSGFKEVVDRAREQARRRPDAFLSAAPASARSLTWSVESSECEAARESWLTATDRIARDPAGAITAARALLEAACKFVLEDLGEVVGNGPHLPDLYKKATMKLKLDPHSEVNESLRRVLRAGCTLVDGLAEMRNALSDAHGKGRSSPKPARRHAELAVMMGGAMASFLLSTLDAQRMSRN